MFVFWLLARSWPHYRRLTFMMMDENVVAASPATVYRVLKAAGCFERWSRIESSKGKGFQQPLAAHEHWHVDISYVNVCGTFYYLISVLDGCTPQTAVTEGAPVTGLTICENSEMAGRLNDIGSSKCHGR